LSAASDPDDERGRWQREREAGELIQQAGTPAWVGREVTRNQNTRVVNTAVAERLFHMRVRRALELAFPAHERESAQSHDRVEGMTT
jgi:hypothetical protein